MKLPSERRHQKASKGDILKQTLRDTTKKWTEGSSG